MNKDELLKEIYERISRNKNKVINAKALKFFELGDRLGDIYCIGHDEGRKELSAQINGIFEKHNYKPKEAHNERK